MLPPLNTIKSRRKKLGWTQKELANRSGVSQSMIAKIERGQIVPSYSIADRIFAALEEGERKTEIRARDIMTREVITIEANRKLKDVRNIMREKGISQIPVLRGGKLVGMITESDILDAYEKHGQHTKELFVGEVMGPVPPVVREDTGISGISGLLKQYYAILVMDGDEIRGIITRADLADLAMRK